MYVYFWIPSTFTFLDGELFIESKMVNQPVFCCIANIKQICVFFSSIADIKELHVFYAIQLHKH